MALYEVHDCDKMFVCNLSYLANNSIVYDDDVKLFNLVSNRKYGQVYEVIDIEYCPFCGEKLEMRDNNG